LIQIAVVGQARVSSLHAVSPDFSFVDPGSVVRAAWPLYWWRSEIECPVAQG
jgi:hypothetical protein